MRIQQNTNPIEFLQYQKSDAPSQHYFFTLSQKSKFEQPFLKMIYNKPRQKYSEFIEYF
jgi:hypothetical protein